VSFTRLRYFSLSALEAIFLPKLEILEIFQNFFKENGDFIFSRAIFLAKTAALTFWKQFL